MKTGLDGDFNIDDDVQSKKKKVSFSNVDKSKKLNPKMKKLKVTRKIEKYNMRQMSMSERDKQEKDKQEGDTAKKVVNDSEEIKHIIKKAFRNQKFKVNVTFNEKFFDRTFFWKI